MGTSVCVVKIFWIRRLTAKALQKIRSENRISFCCCRFFIMLLLKFIAALLYRISGNASRFLTEGYYPRTCFFTESTPEKCYDISTQQKGGRNPWKTTVATTTVTALIWSVRMWHIYALCCGIGYRCVFLHETIIWTENKGVICELFWKHFRNGGLHRHVRLFQRHRNGVLVPE